MTLIETEALSSTEDVDGLVQNSAEAKELVVFIWRQNLAQNVQMYVA